MKELLLNNYEWIFSGIGVFVISIGMIFLKKQENNKNEQSVKIDSSHNNQINIFQNQNTRSSIHKEDAEYNIDAKDVMDQIDNAPPFQKKEIVKNFLGHNIYWEVSYSSVTSIQKNRIDVMARYKGTYPWVYFKANIKDYPFLKIAKKGEPLKIRGEITRIKDGGFEVKVSKIIKGNTINT